MNNRQTVILGVSTVVVLAVVVIVGIFVSAPQTPSQPPEQTQQPQQQTQLSEQQLSDKLDAELPAISDSLTQKYPQAQELYTINRGKLYDQGQWYGTTLTYTGPNEDNRDTLRVLMQKKDTTWVVRTTPPQPILSQQQFKDVPKTILQSINQPAELPGTTSSPAIN